MDFDGSDDYVLGPDYDILSAITISAWVNADLVDAGDGILSKRTSSENAGNWLLRFDNAAAGILGWMVWDGVDSSEDF